MTNSDPCGDALGRQKDVADAFALRKINAKTMNKVLTIIAGVAVLAVLIASAEVASKSDLTREEKKTVTVK